MPEETTTQSIDDNVKVVQQPINKKNRFPGLVREALAIFFWLYLVTKLFIFDIDIFLIEKLFPNITWLINYKFFIIIGILAIIFLATKNIHIILWSIFILFYPIILVFWKIPYLLFKSKSWNIAIAFCDSVISFFKSTKLRFIKTSFFLVSMAITLGSSNKILLWISISVITVIIFLTYIQRIILIFRPSGIYQVYTKIFSTLGDFLRTKPSPIIYEAEPNTSIESMGRFEIQAWTNSVQQLVLFNRVCLFFAKKLKSYQESKSIVISYVYGILLLILFTIFSFTIINFGLFKIDPNYFSFSSAPTFFNFFYYSFNNLLFNTIREIIPSAPISQIFSMLEAFYALFLVAIFISLVLSVKNQKEADEMSVLINNLSAEGLVMEGFIKDTYQFNNIEEAMIALKNLNAAFSTFIDKITKAIM